MSDQETWQDEAGNTLYRIDDGDENAYQVYDPDRATEDSLADDSLSDDDDDNDNILFSSDESVSEDDESEDGSDLLGFPPGKSSADYYGQPPFGDWRWPPDFTNEDKATFWRGATTSGASDYAYGAAYNRVSDFNNPDAAVTGKAGVGRSVESFEQEASMYSYYNPTGIVADVDVNTVSAQDAATTSDAGTGDADNQAPAQAQPVDLTWDDVNWGFVQKLNERNLKETDAGGQQPFWQVGGGLLIGWEHPGSYRALFESLAGGDGSGDAPDGTISVVSRGSVGSRGEIRVTGASDQAAFKQAVREFSQKNITFL